MLNPFDTLRFNARAVHRPSATIVASALCAVLAVSLTSSLCAEAAAPPITVNGAQSTTTGIQRGNMLFVPSSAVFKQIGASVTYKAPGTIVAMKGGTALVRMAVGSRNAVVNGRAQTLATAPFMQAGQLLVPLRLIGEAAGASVLYSASPRAVAVNQRHTAAAAPAANDAAATGAAAGAAAGAANGATAATAAPVADTQSNQGGIPWWVWLLAALVILGIIFALMRRKKEPLIMTTGTPHSAEPVIKTRR